MINSVNLEGYVGADPTIKTIGGQLLAEFLLYNDEEYRGKKRVHKIKIKCWGKLAEVASQYCGQGKKLFLSGSIGSENWVKDGIERRTNYILAKEISLQGAVKQVGIKEPVEF